MSLNEARPRVFLSYARSDGEAFARSLRDRLEAAQVPLWRDREGMEGGRDWWQQITAAIDHVDFAGEPVTAAVQGHDGTVYAALGTGHFGSHIWRREPGGEWAEVAAPA